MQDGTRSVFDHPLASRFEEMDAVLIFNDVLIPWNRVFLYNNIEAANLLYPKTGNRSTTCASIWRKRISQTPICNGSSL